MTTTGFCHCRLQPRDSSKTPGPGPSTTQSQLREIKGWGAQVSADKEEGVSGSSTMRPLSSQERRPHCPHECPQIVRAGASSGPWNIWPQNNMTVGGGGAGGWGGGANEEGSAQPPEENLIVWGLPWVLLIKKKKSLFKCKFVLELGWVGGRQRSSQTLT